MLRGMFLFQVLEVHDQLDSRSVNNRDDSRMDDNEKAIVREMCNVSGFSSRVG